MALCLVAPAPKREVRYGERMKTALRTLGRILSRHWPALIAWYLAGEAAHRLLIQLAGTVGGQTTVGGLLLLPLAVAARLFAYVAMYLTVRPSLPNAQDDDTRDLRGFFGAVFAAILPFFAFYTAWGLLDADYRAFFRIAANIALREAGYDDALLGDRGGLLSVGLLPVVVLLAALGVRIALSVFRERLPSWTLALTVYAEVLWTFMLFMLLSQGLDDALAWWSTRAGSEWFTGIGDWFAGQVAPVAVLWELLNGIVEILAEAVFVPAAWLVVAGVIYGTTFTAGLPRLFREGLPLRGPLRMVTRGVSDRLEGLFAAFSVIWRGGPIIFGSAVLAYTLWALMNRLLTRGAYLLVGPHEADFWAAFQPLILVAVAVIMEPLRVAIVAVSYEAVIARPSAHLDAGPTDDRLDLDEEPDRLSVDAVDAQPERAGDVLGDEEHREEPIGR